MKQKHNKMIVIKTVTIMFAIFIGLFASVFAQYYYFSSGGNSYQQGCSEALEVRVNSEGKNVRAGRFHLLLDDLTTIYPKTDNVSQLRDFFGASTDSFIQWTSEGSPSWKGESNYTILQADRNNGTDDYNGTNNLYANINFKPVFSGGLYDVVFGMEYLSGDATTETTLSMAGGAELINSEHQESYRTGTFAVLQEPCVADTNKPTITNVSIANNSSKISYLSGLTFSLKDEGGVAGVLNVPYIWSGGEWTGNVGGLVSNQYGIDENNGTITFFKKSLQVKVISLNDERVSLTWNKKTWKDSGLNLDVSISSGLLFDFGREKEIKAVFRFADRAGNVGGGVITFNTPKKPEVILDFPKDGDIYVNLNESIKLRIKDDWAGVDPETITVSVYGINGSTDPVIFSGSDLNLSEVQGDANGPDYDINISNHAQFPTSGTIEVFVHAEDFENEGGLIGNYSFTTRPDCSEFQCCDPVLLNLGNENTIYYSNTGLIISGGNNSTFTMDINTGIIDCNTENEGLSVYDGQNNFVFFTDETEINILGTGVKGILSGDTLTLSYIVDSVQLIIDGPENGEIINTDVADVNWHLQGDENQNRLSGYIVEFYDNSGNFVTGGFTNSTGFTQALDDGEYEVFVYPVDLLGNTGDTQSISFTIDREIPICTLSFESNECTSGVVNLVLDTPDDDIYGFNFDGGDVYELWTGPVTIQVSSVGYYTGYIRDYAGNSSGCSVYVSENILDNEDILFNVISVTGYECQTITGAVNVLTGDSCGKDNMNKFKYSWDDGINYLSDFSSGIYLGHFGTEIKNVYIRDGIGNVTGATISYTWLDSGIQYNDVTVLQVGNSSSIINWKTEAKVSDGDCGSGKVEFSGFAQQGQHGTCSVSGDEITYLPNALDQYQGSDFCIMQVSDDEGNTQNIRFTFEGIDTELPTCEVIVPAACTNSVIWISITGNIDDIEEYSWWDMNKQNFGLDTFTGISELGIYTGYVWDSVGNTGMCTGELTDLIFDQDEILYEIQNAVGGECTMITGKVIVKTGSSCGKDDLSDFVYSRDDLVSLGEYGLYSGNYGEKFVYLTITDGAGNSVVTGISYNWSDTNPTLTTDSLIYNVTVTGAKLLYDDLISSMGVRDGDCGSTTINITGNITCTVGSGEWVGSGISVTPPNNEEGTASCTVSFVDDEGNIVDGSVEYTYDTQRPGVNLEGSNYSCMGVNTFGVTGTFTENVNGFVSGNVFVQGGHVGSFMGNGYEYFWTVIVNPMVEFSVQIPDNAAYDNAGNGNTSSDNILTGMFDNVGPDTVTLIQPLSKVYSESTTLMWQSTVDSGCAGVIGYNWEIYEGNCGVGTRVNNGVKSEDDELSVNVSGLIDSGNYCRRVQPVDSLGNKGEWADISFVVDLSNIGCLITPVNTECTSGPVNVQLSADGDYTANGPVYLSWISTGDHSNTNLLTTGVIYSGQVVVGYISQPDTNKSHSCVYTAVNIIDQSLPVIAVLDDVVAEECTTGEAIVVATDDGCGNNPLSYKRNGGSFVENSNTFEQWSGKVGTKSVNVQVKDAVGNITGDSVAFEWINTPISAHDFTGSENVGNTSKTTNWRIYSEVVDGACGNGVSNVMWDDFDDSGTKGECTRSGDEITYTPYPNQIGEDTCTIKIKDDDGSSVSVTIYWEGIDTIVPTCSIDYNSECTSGGVELLVNSSESISSIEGGNIGWLIDGNHATGMINMNGEISVVVADLSNNTGICTTGVYNISTGVLLPPSSLIPSSGTFVNSDVLMLQWSDVESQGCRDVSGYVYEICADQNCNAVLDGGTSDNTGWTTISLSDETYYRRVKTVDILGGASSWARSVIKIDTEHPKIQLEGSNSMCMSTNTFEVTGLFTEIVNGFDSDDIIVNGGYVELFDGMGDTYTWVVSMNPLENVVVKILEGVAYDEAGNGNIGSNELTGIYDNAGPSPVNFNNRQNNVYMEDVVLSWNEGSDVGCAGISGYNWIFAKGTGCEDRLDGGFTEGLSLNFSELSDGVTYSLCVQAVDNFGNVGEWSTGTFDVDLNSIGCIIEESECSSVGVTVTLKQGNPDWTGIYLSWIGSQGTRFDHELTGYEIIPGKVLTGYIQKSEEIMKGSKCYHTIGNIDQIEPTIQSIEIATGYECEMITGKVFVTDEGCGNGEILYNWNDSGSGSDNWYAISGDAGQTEIPVIVYDAVGNEVRTGVNFVWYNTPISAHDFTGSENVGNTSKTTNWRIYSEVVDGACGNGVSNVMWDDFDDSGTKGECTRSGDEITYTPYPNQIGEDTCTIKIKDDDGSGVIVTIYWEGIDTIAPECTLSLQSQQCTSEAVILVISGDETVVEYSFDGITFGNNVEKYVYSIGLYTGFVLDAVGNTGICTGIVDTGVLDLDEPELDTVDWIGKECSTGSITVTGRDNSCGLSGLSYYWSGFENTTNTNKIYSGNVGSQTVNVIVYDGVGHSTGKQVTYTWQDFSVTGHDFTVENVGIGVTVDWKELGGVSAGDCEDVYVSSVDNSKCTTGGNYQLTYMPNQGEMGSDTCTLTVSDGDGSIQVIVTFIGIDTASPELIELTGGVGEQCTNESVFTVTGIFSEEVVGVNSLSLTGENVVIKSFVGDGNIYEWNVEMQGGIGRVWLLTWGITDVLGNQLSGGGTEIILGNFDNEGPLPVTLSLPGTGEEMHINVVPFEWTKTEDQGCASGGLNYMVEICNDELCHNVIQTGIKTNTTGQTLGSLPNGQLYWRVVTEDAYGNIGVSEIRDFVVHANNPSCYISESMCTSGAVILTLTGDTGIVGITGNIDWAMVSNSLYTGEVVGNPGVRAVVTDNYGLTGRCEHSVSNYDHTAPTFTFSNGSGNECEAGSLNIINASDNGGCAGLHESAYKFGTGNWGTVTNYSLIAQQPGSVTVTGYVRDNLGNETENTATYTFNNVVPTANNFATGNIGNSARSITWAQFVEASSAIEGSCGIGNLSFSGVKTNGNKGSCSIDDGVLIYTPNANKSGSDTCIVTIKDNENSIVDVIVTFNGIDTVPPTCNIVEAACTSGTLMLTLTASEPISTPDGWSKTNDITYTLGVVSNTEINVNVSDLLGSTGSCSFTSTNYDVTGPTFVFNNGSGNECEVGSLNIINAGDSGGCAGLHESAYKFGNGSWGIITSTSITAQQPGEVVLVGYVRDSLGNRTSKSAIYTVNDVLPTATGFSVYALSGVDVNWKVESHATEGACGSGALIAEVTGGNIGDCTISGNILSYRPRNNSVTGSDTCELTISDNEGSIITGIIVEFTDINKYPHVELVSPINGDIKASGKITFSWSGVGNNGVISGYTYRIWNAATEWIIEQTGVDFSIDYLNDGSYSWNVYATFVDGSTGGLSDTYSFNITTVPSEPDELGLIKLRKDKCPDGDDSDSFYDGTCEANGGTHGSAVADICGVNRSKYSDEQKSAYLYSYNYGITTICPIQDANLGGYLIRSHFAKMISEFAVNVLGVKPDKGKVGCDQFNDVDKLNDELRNFVTVSCELGLMGLESDGETPAKAFNPNNYVTRAQFGTVLSRLLFGDMYNVKEEENANKNSGFWYQNHLKALKNYGIMTKIDGDWPIYKEQRGWVMIMLKRSDDYGVFAGKVPAKNGVSALFDK